MPRETKSFLMLAALLGLGLASVVEGGFWGPPTKVPNINTSSAETTPTLSPDGQTLYFASDRSGLGFALHNILQSTRTGSGWSAPSLVPNVNSDGIDATTSFSSDGTTLYFDSNGLGGEGDRDIFTSTWTGSAWGTPQNLGSVVNSSSGDFSLFIFSDGLTLYFESARPGGTGGRDIYQCERASTSDPWGAPDATPFALVNSSANDGSPCVSLDGQLLYFDSSRGGLNRLFRSAWDGPNNRWGAPTELIVGPTNHHEAAPFFLGEYGTLYFASHPSPGWDVWQSQWIPEPTSLVLLGAGLVALWRRKRR